MADARFMADAMLGKPTKWLRVMGVDVEYDPSLSDRELLQAAAQEHRILLTCDRRLVRRRVQVPRLLIESDYYYEQVQQVVGTFALEPRLRVLTRCLRCNTLLQVLARCAAAGKVPEYIYTTQVEFKRCPTCDRIYWGGTHRENMLRQIEAMLGHGPSTATGERRSLPSGSGKAGASHVTGVSSHRC